jgi:hypothetical protein
MSFVELDGSLVFLCRRPGRKRPKITATLGLRILLAGIQSIFARRELADHGVDAVKNISS